MTVCWLLWLKCYIRRVVGINRISIPLTIESVCWQTIYNHILTCHQTIHTVHWHIDRLSILYTNILTDHWHCALIYRLTSWYLYLQFVYIGLLKVHVNGLLTLYVDWMQKIYSQQNWLSLKVNTLHYNISNHFIWYRVLIVHWYMLLREEHWLMISEV